MVDWNINRGVLKASELDSHLQKLQDVSADLVEITLEEESKKNLDEESEDSIVKNELNGDGHPQY